MSSYANSKIYKLVSDVDELFYIGSTKTSLPNRFYQHKRDAVTYPMRVVYKHFNEIGWEHVRIILVELFPCEQKCELTMRERYWCDKLNPSLNMSSPHGIIKCVHDKPTGSCLKCRDPKKYQSIDCLCGGKFQRHRQATHNKSQRHLKYEIKNKRSIIKHPPTELPNDLKNIIFDYAFKGRSIFMSTYLELNRYWFNHHLISSYNLRALVKYPCTIKDIAYAITDPSEELKEHDAEIRRKWVEMGL
jgi:hypothetical protein